MADGRVTTIAIDDVPPNRRRGADVRVLLSPATVGSKSGFTGVAHLEPGDSIIEHYHPYSEEFIFLVSGDLVVIADGEPVELRAGEAMLVPTGMRHRLENRVDERGFLVFHLGPLAPKPHLGHVDTEPAPGAEAPKDGRVAR